MVVKTDNSQSTSSFFKTTNLQDTVRQQEAPGSLGHSAIAEKAFGDTIVAKKKKKKKEQLEANPRHLKGLCGTRPRQSLEHDGLRHQRHRKHLYEGLLSNFLPERRRNQALLQMVWTPNLPYGSRAMNGLLPKDIDTSFAEV